MRILVCGGRHFGYKFVPHKVPDPRQRLAFTKILADVGAEVIITGCADGADALARDYAKAMFLPLFTFYAAWDQLGRKAGPIRNLQMVTIGQPDGVLAFPGTKGTESMIRIAEENNIPTRRVSEAEVRDNGSPVQ